MKEILKLFSDAQKEAIQGAKLFSSMEELRLVAGGGICLYGEGKMQMLHLPVSQKEVGTILSRACEHSVYAAQPQLTQGYVTIRGGHRIGVAGRAAMDGQRLSAITDISALCIRVARDCPMAAEGLLPLILSEGQIKSTLLIGVPGSGKTTCLRSLAHLLGGAQYGKKVVVIDARGELASVHLGVPQLSVGAFSCVLDRFPKKEAIEHAVRALAPDVIITDELGSAEDMAAAQNALTSGVSLLASVHGSHMSCVKENRFLLPLLKSGLLRQGIFLSKRRGPGTVERIVTDMTKGPA